MKIVAKIIAIIIAISVFVLVPIFAHWQWDTICAVVIIIIGTLIASNYIHIRSRNNLTKEKSKHQMHQGGS